LKEVFIFPALLKFPLYLEISFSSFVQMDVTLIGFTCAPVVETKEESFVGFSN